jgi:uncharacterized protein with von Willebrand factor type A (vWA) domain
MFIDFLIMLRAYGLKVSMNEWLTLMDGLDCGLHGSSLTGFYNLCRAVLVKSETDYDRFDRVFTAFFKDVPFDELSDELMDWLSHYRENTIDEYMLKMMEHTGLSQEEIEQMLKERLEEQKEEHHGGNKWVGTGGYTPFGNHGRVLGGVRIGGASAYRSAYRVAGERHFRDWRSDCTVDSHQFQMAFRRLRQLSRGTDQPKTEFDIDGTIHETCNSGGVLHIEYRRPRRNTLKLMMLIDSGGSMARYQRLTSLLFQSLNKVNTFSDLRIYYFHNCLKKTVFTEPSLSEESAVETDWILKNISEDYRVIFVGDAEMSMDELVYGMTWDTYGQPPDPAVHWFDMFKNKYAHIIWLYPQPEPTERYYLTETFFYMKEENPAYPMFRMSIDGIDKGMEELMKSR